MKVTEICEHMDDSEEAHLALGRHVYNEDDEGRFILVREMCPKCFAATQLLPPGMPDEIRDAIVEETEKMWRGSYK